MPVDRPLQIIFELSATPAGRRPCRHQAQQTLCGRLHLRVSPLSRPVSRREKSAAANHLEVAIWEFVAAARIDIERVVHAQEPGAVFAVAMLVDEGALGGPGRAVNAPFVSFVQNHVSLGNELNGMLITGVVQFQGRPAACRQARPHRRLGVHN